MENDGEFFVIGLTAGRRADIDTRKARSTEIEVEV